MPFSPKDKTGEQGNEEAVGIIGMAESGIDQPDKGLEIEEASKDSNQRDSDNSLGLHICLSRRLLKYNTLNRQRKSLVPKLPALSAVTSSACAKQNSQLR